MTFMELAKARFSCRKFSDKPIEKEKLEQVLEAGRIAPTAKNQQPQRIYILQSADALEKLETLTPCVYGAKTVLLFTYNKNEDWKNPHEEGVRSGTEDVSIVATHIMLEAAELGLNTVWVNNYPNSKLQEVFHIPMEEENVLLMPIGYCAEDAQPAPRHEQSKAIDDMVQYI